MGTPRFAVPSLQVLLDHPQIEVVGVVTQPDKPLGRSRTSQPSPVKQLALQHNLIVWTPEKIKHNPDLIATLAKTRPDVIVVAAYGKLLPQEILDLPKRGVVNIHGSFLPEYRGASPVVGSILNGDIFTGVTLMKMVLAMDAGPIIAKSHSVAIEPTDTTETLTQKLSIEGAELLHQQLVTYLEKKLIPLPQNESLATTVKLINKEDGQINWNDSAELIERKIRAYQPWPGAQTLWQGQRLKLISGEVTHESPTQIGTVWLTPDNYPAVSTGQGSLKITGLQLEGKAVVSGRDFLLGRPSLIGATLHSALV